MSTTMSRQPSRAQAPPSGSGQARQVVAARSERRDPLRRRWGRVGGGVLAALVGAWLFASIYRSADDRSEVLAITGRVERYEVIERSDLRVVMLPTDSEVASVPASRLDELVGRVAATDLTAGSLLAENQLLAEGERLVAAGEAVVGVLVGPGDAPVTGVDRGAPVSVVVRPAAGVPGDIEEMSGWVADVSDAMSSGERPLEVVVPRADAALVSAAAADRRVTIVAVGEG